MTGVLQTEIAPTKVTVAKKDLSIAVGKTAVVGYTTTPSIVTATPTWKSSNKKVATVDSAGVVTAKAFGSARITVKFGKKSAACRVSVTANKTAAHVFLGKQWSMKNSLVNVPDYETAKYASNNKSVATVSRAGVITGKAIGKCTVTATINGVKYTQKIAVCTPSLKLNKTKATIYKGDHAAVSGTSVTLKATADPADSKITWTSSNTRVATVSATGVVTAAGTGTATIRAAFTYGGKTYTKSCTVTVKFKRALTAKVTSIYDDDIYNDCYIEFQNNTNKKITYVTLNIKQYDNRGYRLSSPYDYYYLNETLKGNSKGTYYFWVNDETRSASVSITKVWFSDGSTYVPR